jgi:hypothetical protein
MIFMKKEDERKLHPKAQEAIRVRIVAFLKSGKRAHNRKRQTSLWSIYAL